MAKQKLLEQGKVHVSLVDCGNGQADLAKMQKEVQICRTGGLGGFFPFFFEPAGLSH